MGRKINSTKNSKSFCVHNTFLALVFKPSILHTYYLHLTVSNCSIIFKQKCYLHGCKNNEREDLYYLQAFSMKPSIFTARTFQYTVHWKMFNQIQAYGALWSSSRFFICKLLDWSMFPTVRSKNSNLRFP